MGVHPQGALPRSPPPGLSRPAIAAPLCAGDPRPQKNTKIKKNLPQRGLLSPSRREEAPAGGERDTRRAGGGTGSRRESGSSPLRAGPASPEGSGGAGGGPGADPALSQRPGGSSGPEHGAAFVVGLPQGEGETRGKARKSEGVKGGGPPSRQEAAPGPPR